MAAAALVAVSCSEDNDEKKVRTVTFEAAQLDDKGYINDRDYTEGDMVFTNRYTAEYGSWSGFAVSNRKDTSTPGYENMYSVYTAGGSAGSSNFAVAYYEAYTSTPATMSFAAGKELVIRSADVCNSTYAALAIVNGSDFSRKFASGDWYKVIFTGYTAAGDCTGTVDFYAADYRGSSPFVCSGWTAVDLSALGAVNRVEITMESTDTGSFGINTPCYICIDNVTYEL